MICEESEDLGLGLHLQMTIRLNFGIIFVYGVTLSRTREITVAVVDCYSGSAGLDALSKQHHSCT